MFLTTTWLGTWSLFRQVKIPPLTCRNKLLVLDSALGGVSILKPLKGADPSLFSNLESFFKLSSALPFELLFSLESKDDPAFQIVNQLIALYPKVHARVFILNESAPPVMDIKNPKLRNLAESYARAKYDLIFISDSNVRIRSFELDHLLSLVEPNTGMVTSIVSGIEFSGIGGALESVFLGTFYARFMALSNRYAKPCVVGKVMLFRKSQAIRFGGLTRLSEFLAEDFVAGETMRKLGLTIRTSNLPVLQVLGSYSFKTFWNRHLRWGRIRKAHAPLPFFVEPFFSPIPMSLLGAGGLSSLGLVTFGAGLLGSLVFVCALDSLSYLRVTQSKLRFIPCFPLVWCLRELLALPLWIQIASSNQIDWRGNRFTLAPGGLLGEK